MYLTFICIFGSLLILFRFFEAKLISNKLYLYFSVFSFLLLSLFPFFILGPYSAIGGYDEQDGQILWYWLLNELGSNEKYIYQYAGGAYSKHAFLSGNEVFSLYKFISSLLPIWISTTIFKLLGLLILYAGIYQSSRKIFNLPRLQSTYIGIFAATTTYLPYYFAIGGYGWNISLLSWIPLVFFMEKRKLHLYSKAVVLGILSTITSEFFLLIPIAFYSYIVFFIFLYTLKKISFSYHQILAAIVTSACFFAGHMLQARELMEVVNYAARFLYSPFDALTLSDLIYTKTRAILLSFRPPHFLIVLTIAIFFILKFFNKEKIKLLILMISLVFLLPLLLAISFNLLNIPIAKNFRWEQLVYIYIAGFPFFLMLLFAENLKKIAGVYTLGVMSVVGISINASAALKDMNMVGSNITKTYYAELFNKIEDKDEYRVVSNRYRPPPGVPLYYGMSTLDGLKLSSGVRRMYFFKFLNNLKNPHTHRHTVKFKNIGGKINLLKMANVKYIASNLPVKNLRLIDRIEGLQIKDISSRSYVPNEINEIYLADDMFLYELTEVWPMIFSSEIKSSSHSYTENEYYEEMLKNENFVGLISIEDIKMFDLQTFESSMSELKEYSISDEGIKINLNKGGAVTINLEFNDRWKATCNGQDLKVFPTNAIMMSLIAPDSCKEIKLNFI